MMLKKKTRLWAYLPRKVNASELAQQRRVGRDDLAHHP